MNDKHKLIYIISGKNPLISKGGYASYSYNLAKLLTSLGYQVEIFCFGLKDQILNTEIGTVNIVGSKLYSTLLKDIEMAGLIILAPKLALVLKSVIASEAKQSSISSQQIIIWGIGPWSLAGALLKVYFNVIPAKVGIHKLILFADYFTSIKHEFLGTLSGISIKDHGFWNKAKVWIAYITIIPLYTKFELFLLKFSDKIITHYSSTEKILKDEFRVKDKKFIRLPYHVELLKRQKTPPVIARSESSRGPTLEEWGLTIFLKSKLPLILLICRHDGRKGINYLLHAFSILNDRGIKYSAAIIGGGSFFKAHKQLAKKLNLSNISLLGFIPNLQPFFKKASLFVFPSLEEGSSSLAILEAMKAGLPIVATNVDGIKEDLVDYQSAMLVSPKDQLALADAMQKLLQNPKLAKKLGQNAKNEYLKKHNPDMVKRAVGKFLDH